MLSYDGSLCGYRSKTADEKTPVQEISDKKETDTTWFKRRKQEAETEDRVMYDRLYVVSFIDRVMFIVTIVAAAGVFLFITMDGAPQK